MGQKFIGTRGSGANEVLDDTDLETLSSYAPTESTITNFGPPTRSYTPQSSTGADPNSYHSMIPQNVSSIASQSLNILRNLANRCDQALSVNTVLNLLSDHIPINFVATMGLTGHGKSTLIKLLTPPEDHKAITTSGGMQAGTTDFKMHPVVVPGRPLFILIDFPGFGSATMKDSEVLLIIYSWFSQMRPAGVKLSTVLYAHDITAPRLTPEMEQGWRIFKAIVGEKNFKNVGIVGTKWDVADYKPRTERKFGAKERELKEGLWRDVIARGGRVHRSKGIEEDCDEDDDMEGENAISAEEWHLAGETARGILWEHANDKKCKLQLQEEIKNHVPVWDTEAGKLIMENEPSWKALREAEAEVESWNEAHGLTKRLSEDEEAKRKRQQREAEGKERQNMWMSNLIRALQRFFKSLFKGQ